MYNFVQMNNATSGGVDGETTKTATEASINELIVKFWIYCAEGILLIAMNFIILGAILKHSILRIRKEYIIVAGLAFVDGMNGLATFSAGAGRIMLLVSEQGYVNVSQWRCMWMPWNLIWIWCDPLISVMLFVISIDRLLAVSIPFRYFIFDRMYSFALLGTAYGPIMMSCIAAVVLTFNHREPKYPLICYTSMGLDKDYYIYWHTNVRIYAALASVFVYVIVVIISMLRKPKPQMQSTARGTRKTNAAATYDRKQRRLTNTLGLSCLFTLLFYVLPIGFEQYSINQDNSTSNMNSIIPYLFIVNNLNSMANFFLYTMRHRDMRLGVHCLLTCKPLTPVMLGHKVASPPSPAHEHTVPVEEIDLEDE